MDPIEGKVFARAADNFCTDDAKRPQKRRSDPEASEHVLCVARYRGMTSGSLYARICTVLTLG